MGVGPHGQNAREFGFMVGAVEISEGGIAEAICSSIGMTYGA